MASGSPFCMALKTALPADARYAVELQWRQSKCSSTTGTEKVVRQRSVWPWAVDWMYCNVEQLQWNNKTVHQQQKLKKSKQDIGWSDHRSLPLFWGEYSLTTGPYPYWGKYCLTTGPYPDSEVLSDHRSSPWFWGIVWPHVLKPVLNWANVCSAEHTSDASTNYDSFLNLTFSSLNMVRTVQTLLHSQLACNEMQALAWTCSRRAADSMIENAG